MGFEGGLYGHWEGRCYSLAGRGFGLTAMTFPVASGRNDGGC